MDLVTTPSAAGGPETGRQLPDLPGWAVPYVPACAAVAALLHPHAEVVLHDLAADRIVAIWNPMSGRAAGDPSLLEELPEEWLGELDGDGAGVLGPYPKVLLDGRALTSVSAVLRDHAGARRGLLCINLDRSPLDRVVELLQGFAAPVTPRPPELFERDWREQIALRIDAFCRDRHVHRDRMDRATRLKLVRELDAAGLFATRHAAQHAATALGVSRATVYALLKETRR